MCDICIYIYISTHLILVLLFQFLTYLAQVLYKKMPHLLPFGASKIRAGERGEFRHGTKGGVHLGLGRLGSAVPGGRALPTEEWWKTAGGESWPLGFGRVVFDV